MAVFSKNLRQDENFSSAPKHLEPIGYCLVSRAGQTCVPGPTISTFTKSQKHLERLMVRYVTVCRHFAPVLGLEPNSPWYSGVACVAPYAETSEVSTAENNPRGFRTLCAA
jgi:hypothetical protein